jgi:putative Ca2+/H+ antiporter (TMEM165/GDT1 family)
MAAFALVDGIAILLGTWITSIIPINYLKTISGIIFIIVGLLMIFKKDNDGDRRALNYHIFITGFLLITITEWGDKTQISAALFAIQYNPILVFIGTITALSVLSVVAIFFGKIISKRVDNNIITKIGGIIFIIIGIIFLI